MESRFLADKLSRGETTSNMQIVVIDIFGYALRRAHAQLAAILAMTTCFRSAIDVTGESYAVAMAHLDAHVQRDTIMLPTGTGLAASFPFGLPGVSLDFVDSLLEAVRSHNAGVGRCSVFEASFYCDCHSLLLPCIGISEGPTVLYRDVNDMINVAGDTVIAATSIASLAEPAQVFLTDIAHRTLVEYIPRRSKHFRPYYEVETASGAHRDIHQYVSMTVAGLNTNPAAGLGVMKDDQPSDIADATGTHRSSAGNSVSEGVAEPPDTPPSFRHARDMVTISGTAFAAGALASPSASLVVSGPFLIGATPVTQSDYELLMGRNPSRFSVANHPVESVSWFDAVQFCNALSAAEKRDAVYEISGSEVVADPTRCGYRLPSEAEWEMCCRSADKADQPYGALESVAWYGRNAGGTTHPVGALDPNRGVFDLLGNVWEWCGDWFQPGYPPGTLTDYTGPPEGFQRVLRGGSWRDIPLCVTPVFRHHAVPSKRDSTIGFRLARTVTDPRGV
jgi:formylglycine-generating enzyme